MIEFFLHDPFQFIPREAGRVVFVVFKFMTNEFVGDKITVSPSVSHYCFQFLHVFLRGIITTFICSADKQVESSGK